MPITKKKNMENKNIKKYIDLLLYWNANKINLIGKSTIDDIENRHILDSAQLLDLLTEEEKNNSLCADFGTGAGFPGVILSILGVKNMTLIEKSIQKCNFLKEAIKFSPNKINILNENINNIKDVKFDIIFSRALADLNTLLYMVEPFLKNNTKCIFLKGKKKFCKITVRFCCIFSNFGNLSFEKNKAKNFQICRKKR